MRHRYNIFYFVYLDGMGQYGIDDECSCNFKQPYPCRIFRLSDSAGIYYVTGNHEAASPQYDALQAGLECSCTVKKQITENKR